MDDDLRDLSPINPLPFFDKDKEPTDMYGLTRDHEDTSPELKFPFRHWANKECKVLCLVIDEAHQILSEEDFRPEFQKEVFTLPL